MTNTTPVDAYRGAGRPEATFLVERLMDKMADELNMDPVELRRKNLIPKFDNGYTVPLGLTYDSGDYETALNKALGIFGYENFRQEQQAAARKRTLSGCRRHHLCGNLRPRPKPGGGSSRLPGRSMGKRDCARDPGWESPGHDWRITTRTRRGNHLRSDHFR